MHLEGCDEFGNVTCGAMVATKCLVISYFANNVKVSVISMYAQRNRAIVDEFITLGSIMLPYLLKTSMDKISFNNVFDDVVHKDSIFAMPGVPQLSKFDHGLAMHFDSDVGNFVCLVVANFVA